MPMPPARLVPPLARIRLLAIRMFSLCWFVSGAGRFGVPTRMAPAYAPPLLCEDVVGDLEVAGVGVDEDAAALGDRWAGRPVGPPPIWLMLAGKSTGRRRGRRSRRCRPGTLEPYWFVLRREDRDDRRPRRRPGCRRGSARRWRSASCRRPRCHHRRRRRRGPSRGPTRPALPGPTPWSFTGEWTIRFS